MKTLINLITCFLTLAIITLFFYIKFTKNISNILLTAAMLETYYAYFVMLFIVSFSIFILLIVSWIIKMRLQKKENLKPSKYLIAFAIWYKKLNIFYKTYGIIFDYLSPKYTTYLIKFTKKFLNFSKQLNLILILTFVTVPRIIVVSVLFFEIYNQKLHYYFYSLFLLFIPLLFKFFVFVLNDIGPRLLPEFNKFIDWDYSNDNEYEIKTATGLQKVKAIGLRFKKEHLDKDLDHFLDNFYYPMLYIGPEMEVNFMPRYSKITMITLLCYLGLHTIAWGSLLIFY